MKRLSKSRYTSQELEAIDRIVAGEKKNARGIKPGKKVSQYLKKISK